MAPVKINIISVRKSPSGDPARVHKLDTLVTYGVEGEGTDFLVIPDDNPTKEAIQKAVEAHIKGRHPAAGASFELP
jgi:hypothetical protein